MEDDAFAIRFWIGNVLATPYRILAASFSGSDRYGDTVNPTNGTGWCAVTFNGFGADLPDLDPTGGRREANVLGSLVDTGDYMPYFSDWVSCIPVRPHEGTIRIGMIRVAMPAQAYSEIASWVQPDWLDAGTRNARWQKDQSGCWTANPAVNRGRDYTVLGTVGIDHAINPSTVLISAVRPLGHGPIIGLQYLTRSRGVVIANCGDSVASGAGSSGAVNDFVTQACAAMSEPARPVVPLKVACAEQDNADHLRRACHAIAQRPAIIHVQGFSRNGWDGSYEGWIRQFAQNLLIADEASRSGCKVIISTGVPAGLDELDLFTYNELIYPELLHIGFGQPTLLDSARLVCETKEGVFTGRFLPTCSSDGANLGDAGHAQLAAVFQSLVSAFVEAGKSSPISKREIAPDGPGPGGEAHLTDIEGVNIDTNSFASMPTDRLLRHLLPFNVLLPRLRISETDQDSVTLRLSELKEIIRTLVYFAPFDEGWYLRAYPEIGSAIQAGYVSSAHTHFLWHGYFEGRHPHGRYFPEGSPGDFFHIPEIFFVYLVDADRLSSSRRRIASCDIYRDAINAYPASVHARVELGKTLFQLRRFRESETILLSLDSNVMANTILADIAGGYRLLERRVMFITANLSAGPQPDLISRARIAYELGDLTTCVGICRRFMSDPSPDVAIFCKEKYGSIQEERAILSDIIRSRKGITPPVTVQIDMAYYLSRFGKIRLASNLIDSIPNLFSGIFEMSDTSLVRLIEATRLTRGRDVAISFLTNVTAANGSDIFKLLLGRNLYEAGRPSDAVDVLMAISDALRRHESAELFALASLRLGNIPQTLAICRTGLGLWPLSYWPVKYILTALFESHVLNVAECGAQRSMDIIPQHLLQFWDQDTPPAEVQAAIDTWSDFNPNVEHRIFSDKTARDFLMKNYEIEIVELFDFCHHPAMRSDFFRIAYLALEGGIYVDADEICVGSIIDFLKEYPSSELYLIASNGADLYLYNGFIACTRENKFVMLTFDQIVRSLRSAKASGFRASIWDITGPGQISRAVADIVLANPGASESISIIAETDYQEISKTVWMEYKGTTAGNWRV
jgi:hypothetical protein